MKSICENCSNYIYDDESECYCCDAALDEDEMRHFITANTGNCPFFSFYNDYRMSRN